MTSKEYLSQIYNLDHIIYLMRLEAEEYRRLSYSLPGQDFTKPFVKSSNPNTEAPFMKWLIKALDKEKEIEDLLKKMEELTNDITNTIDEVENLDYRVLLKLRYINQRIGKWQELLRLNLLMVYVRSVVLLELKYITRFT